MSNISTYFNLAAILCYIYPIIFSVKKLRKDDFSAEPKWYNWVMGSGMLLNTISAFWNLAEWLQQPEPNYWWLGLIVVLVILFLDFLWVKARIKAKKLREDREAFLEIVDNIFEIFNGEDSEKDFISDDEYPIRI